MDRDKVLSSFTVQDDGCWRWDRARNRHGYGVVTIRSEGRKTSTTAHRLVYELLAGPIPPGLQLDHLCRNPTCVNPAHLEPVTNGVNHRRAIDARGTFLCGHPLTPENTNLVSGYRRCATCRREQNTAYKRKWRAANPEKVAESQRRWAAKNPGYVRPSRRA